jgi:hypothetical protein
MPRNGDDSDGDNGTPGVAEFNHIHSRNRHRMVWASQPVLHAAGSLAAWLVQP